jgi:ABC-type proline/glycine betaine transport system permease subunit
MHWFWRAAIAILCAVATGICVFHITDVHSEGFIQSTHRIGRVPSFSLFFLFPPTIVTLLVYSIVTRLLAQCTGAGTETRCRKCGYILRGISEPRCPECGERI